MTGLSPRITKKELEKHFSNEGKVCLQKLSILYFFHGLKYRPPISNNSVFVLWTCCIFMGLLLALLYI